MNFEKQAFLLSFIERLEAAHIPADKPHLHKILFLIREMKDNEVPFEFFYKNGPHSYDLEAELIQMRGYGAIVQVQILGSGTFFVWRIMPTYFKNMYQISRYLNIST